MSSMAYNSASGLTGMLKQGTRHFFQDENDGSSSVVLSNIDACLQLARMLSTSLGPQGRCKLVVNHLEKLMVTSDCASILKEINVEHPAAQLLTQACTKQEEECGDQTNFLLAFSGELLWQTALLIGQMTWQPAPEILAGYQRALQLCKDVYLPAAVCQTIPTQTLHLEENEHLMIQVLRPVLASKVYGCQDVLAPLVAKACRTVLQSTRSDSKKTTRLSVEAIRTVKILGTSVQQCTLIDGYVARSGVESNVKSATQAKLAVFACGIEASATEAKGTVLMKTADDLLQYNKTEEAKMQEIIEGIAAAGVKIVVTGGNVSDMALHFINRCQLLCLRMGSKWELQRLCKAVQATPLVRLGPPTPDEMGFVDTCQVRDLDGRTITVFDTKTATTTTTTTTSDAETTSTQKSRLVTLVLRASTTSVLNDLERAVDDAVHAIAQVTNQSATSGQLVYGGGAVEMALATALQKEADQTPGLEQYALSAFAKALQIIPKTLAENAGWDSNQVVANLQAAHAAAAADDAKKGFLCDVGVDITGTSADGTAHMAPKQPQTSDDNEDDDAVAGVMDVMSTKLSALQLAVDAATTILKIDQIIMSKPSGGPKPQ